MMICVNVLSGVIYFPDVLDSGCNLTCNLVVLFICSSMFQIYWAGGYLGSLLAVLTYIAATAIQHRDDRLRSVGTCNGNQTMTLSTGEFFITILKLKFALSACKIIQFRKEHQYV